MDDTVSLRPASSPSLANHTFQGLAVRCKARKNTDAILNLIQQMPRISDLHSIAIDIKDALSVAVSDFKDEHRGVAVECKTSCHDEAIQLSFQGSDNWRT